MSLRQFLAASVAAVAFSGAAVAADLPSRRVAPVAPYVAPIFTWTGFYAGVNAGYGWGSFTKDPKYVFDNPSGFVGGGQIGYNYQIGQFVVGLETDIQYADLKSNNNSFAIAVPGYAAGGSNAGVEWFGTVRGRLGFAIDRALVYATGGFAYGGGGSNNYVYNGVYYSGNDNTRTGWTLGGGVEYAFTDNLTAKVEGLYVNLGKSDNNFAYVGNRKDTEFGVVRAGLNYKFNTF